MKFASFFYGMAIYCRQKEKERKRYMEFDAVVQKRRSVRKFEARPIDRGLLEQMIEAAIQAPTWKNSQTPRYHVITSKEMLQKVKEQALPTFNATNVADAPVLIVTTFVKNRSGYERSGEPSNELGNGWGCYDLGLHNEHLVLKAADLGLASLIMGIRDAAVLRELLSIDEQEVIVAVIGVGYGAVEPEMPKRKQVADITTFY